MSKNTFIECPNVTVKQLIEILKTCPQDYEVIWCDGGNLAVNYVEVEPEFRFVNLMF